ncbi:MAG TPA: coproporphyrinogen III oxidase family protein, partial [Polyangiaceae bacterium]
LETGLDLKTAADELGVEAWPKERQREAEKLIANGRLLRDGNRIWIPKRFWIYANDTAARLF